VVDYEFTYKLRGGELCKYAVYVRSKVTCLALNNS